MFPSVDNAELTIGGPMTDITFQYYDDGNTGDWSKTTIDNIDGPTAIHVKLLGFFNDNVHISYLNESDDDMKSVCNRRQRFLIQVTTGVHSTYMGMANTHQLPLILTIRYTFLGYSEDGNARQVCNRC